MICFRRNEYDEEKQQDIKHHERIDPSPIISIDGQDFVLTSIITHHGLTSSEGHYTTQIVNQNKIINDDFSGDSTARSVDGSVFFYCRSSYTTHYPIKQSSNPKKSSKSKRKRKMKKEKTQPVMPLRNGTPILPPDLRTYLNSLDRDSENIIIHHIIREEKVELIEDCKEFHDTAKPVLRREEKVELIEVCKDLDDTGCEIKKKGRKRKGRHRRRKKTLKRRSFPLIFLEQRGGLHVCHPKYASHPNHDPNKWILSKKDMRHHFPSYFLNHDWRSCGKIMMKRGKTQKYNLNWVKFEKQRKQRKKNTMISKPVSFSHLKFRYVRELRWLIGLINEKFQQIVISYNEYFKCSPSPIIFSTIFNQIAFHWFGGVDAPSSEALITCLVDWGPNESRLDIPLKKFLVDFKDKHTRELEAKFESSLKKLKVRRKII